jgi:hypothetical protein
LIVACVYRTFSLFDDSFRVILSRYSLIYRMQDKKCMKEHCVSTMSTLMWYFMLNIILRAWCFDLILKIMVCDGFKDSDMFILKRTSYFVEYSINLFLKFTFGHRQVSCTLTYCVCILIELDCHDSTRK